LICANNANAVRRSRFGRRASAFNAATIVSWNAVSFVALGARSYFDSCTCSMRRYLRTVLRDRLVARVISRNRLALAKVHPPDLADHRHGDHPFLSPAAAA
jgi:hypothetical protein